MLFWGTTMVQRRYNLYNGIDIVIFVKNMVTLVVKKRELFLFLLGNFCSNEPTSIFLPSYSF
jgi:hypothetical protein